MDYKDIIKTLGLMPHPKEGGYFLETYRSDENIHLNSLPEKYSQNKAFSTAIYYMLTSETKSAMHRIISDEIFHFYSGDPVEMLQLYPDGSHKIIIIGSDISAGQIPQVIVPAGVWQGSRLIIGGKYALMGTTVAPAFDYSDYEHGDFTELVSAYPSCENILRLLCM